MSVQSYTAKCVWTSSRWDLGYVIHITLAHTPTRCTGCNITINAVIVHIVIVVIHY